MIDVYYDIESRSKVDLKEVGAQAYARHPSTEIILFQWAVDDGPVRHWQPLDEDIPDDLEDVFARYEDGEPMRWIGANNVEFDNIVLRVKDVIDIHPNDCYDILVSARRHNLPASLARLGEWFDLPGDQKKLEAEGKKGIALFCQPLPANRTLAKQGHVYADRTTHPEEWQRYMLDYGDGDVIATRAISKLMPTWNDTPFEAEVFRLHCEINNRGIRLDRALIEGACRELDKARITLEAQVRAITGGIVPTQREKFRNFIGSRWRFALAWFVDRAGKSTMGKDVVDKVIARGDCPEDLRHLLRLSRELTSSSTAKYYTMRMMLSVSDDDYARGCYQYAGAHTLRWSAKLVQPHNFPRGTVGQKIVDAIIAATLHHTVSWFDFDLFASYSSALRGTFIPDDGNEIVQSDLGAIEGRMTAFVCGEQHVLDGYAAGRDMYIGDYADCFAVDYDALYAAYKDGDKGAKAKRQIGKPINLSLGYAGGVGAFVPMAANYGIDLDQMAHDLYSADALDTELLLQAHRLYHNPRFQRNIKATGLCKETWMAIDATKRAWRRNHPATVRTWAEIETQCRNAIANPGMLFYAGAKIDGVPMLEIECDDNHCLTILVPGGSRLTYWNVRISSRPAEPGEDDNDDTDDTVIVHYAPGSSGHMMKKIMHGGIALENIVQKMSRNILAGSMLRVDAAFPGSIMFHTHDEMGTNTPRGRITRDWLEHEMCVVPEWAPGLPLAAEGEVMTRYHK